MRHRLRFWETGRGRAGLVIVGVVVGVAIFGPLIAPYSPSELVGTPGQPPGSGFLLGTDYLGHDLLSRVLWGGWSVLWLSFAAALLAFATGSIIGLVAGYSRNLLEPVLMRSIDVVLVFPSLLFFMILATAVGTSSEVLVIGVAIVVAPGVARIVFTATREASIRGYVESAVARGERTTAILHREIIPTILPVLIANFGLILTYSILLIAAVNFLGLGLTPPASNWALMIAENRVILSLNIWATVIPAALIAALTIGVNLVGDAISHTLGHSNDDIQPITAAVATLGGDSEITASSEHT